MLSFQKTFLWILLLAGFSVAGDDARDGSWPMFRGNPQLTGVAQGTLPSNPDVLWTFQAGDVIESTAAIYNGTVYVGSLDGFMYAVDFNTGELKWKIEASDEIKSSPSIHDDIVYFGDELGTFYAVQSESGDSLWTFLADAGIVSSANFYKDRVLFGAYDNYLYCLSVKDGALIWKVESEGYIHGTPAIVDNKVFITGCDGYFRMIDIDSGMEINKVELGDYVAASPAIRDDKAFFGTFGNQIFCVNLTSAEIAWKFEDSKRQFPYYASAAVTDKVVVVGGRDKLIRALNPESGEQLWSFTARSKIESSPLIVNDRVIAASVRGKIVILDLSSGDAVWEFDTGTGVVASPAFADGKFVIGADDGTLYCFGKK